MYFSFDQTTIYQRLVQTLTLRTKLGSEIYSRPDFYNPLWIDITLAFILTVVGNISRYFHSTSEFHFNFAVLEKAFSLVFGLAILVPALVSLCFFVYGIKLSVPAVVGIIAIYSYSNLFFVLGASFYLIPLQLVGFTFMLIFAAFSALSLIVVYSGFIEQSNDPRKKTVIVAVLVLQALALLTYRFAFFT